MADLSEVASRPLTGKGRETRQRIIDAAADLVYERGVAGVSIDDVLRTTGTSKSQMYHYFNDKNDLVHAVIERQRERVLGFHQPELESLSSWDDLQRWRNMIVETQAVRACRYGCPLGSLVNELVELDEFARAQLSGAFANWEQMIAQGLAGMVEAGKLRGDANTADLAVSVIASLQGGLLLAEMDRSTRPLEVALDAAIAHLRSFAPSEPEPPSSTRSTNQPSYRE
ncbi:MAG TPA: TetR/AcrR family transcriptional regulator [Acidimicrobiales bacterium]|jgi:AcrR family transcriptional regulator|nr:TetR/AcrR family transcriptional regulator [Acidimicrobiales bacterium]